MAIFQTALVWLCILVCLCLSFGFWYRQVRLSTVFCIC